MRLRPSLGVALVLFAASTLPAADRDHEFALGLQDRRYFDLAAEQFLKIKNDPARDEDQVIEAITGLVACELEAADQARTFEERQAFLRRAAAQAEAGIKGYPDHEAVRALKIRRAEVIVARGREVTRELERDLPKEERERLARLGKRLFEEVLAELSAWQKGWREAAQNLQDKPQLGSYRDEEERQELMALTNLAYQAQNQIGWTGYYSARLLTDKKERDAALAKAQATFAGIVKEQPDYVVALSASIGKGLCEQQLGNDAEAVKSLDFVLATDFTQATRELHFTAYYQKLQSLNRLKRYKESQELAASLTSRFRRPGDPRAEAVRLEEAHAYAGAAAQAEEAAKKEGKPALDAAAASYRKAIETISPIARGDGPFSINANELLAAWVQKLEKLGAKPASRLAERDLALAEGERLLSEEKCAEAVAQFRQAIRLSDPAEDAERRLRAWIQAARCYAKLGQYYESGLVFGRVAREYPDSEWAEQSARLSANLLGAWYAENRTAYATETYLEAQNYLAVNYPADPASVRAAFRLADIRRGAKRYEEAARLYRRVPEGSPFYEKARYLAGLCDWKRFLEAPDAPRPREEAEKTWEAFVAWAKAQPQVSAEQTRERMHWLAETRISLGDLYLYPDVSKPDQALALLEQFRALHPDETDLHPRALFLRVRGEAMRGVALVKQDPAKARAPLERAENDLNALLKEFPAFDRNSAVCLALGKSFVAAANEAKDVGLSGEQVRYRDKAAQYLNQAIRINPNLSLRDYATVGSTLYDAGMYEESERVFQDLIARFKDQPEHEEAVWEARDWVGKSLMQRSQWERAAPIYEALKDHSPTIMDYRKALALSYEQTEQYGKALIEWSVVEETLPQGGGPWFETRWHAVWNECRRKNFPRAFQLVATTVVAYPELGGPVWQPRFDEIVKSTFPDDLRKRYEALLAEARGTAAGGEKR